MVWLPAPCRLKINRLFVCLFNHAPVILKNLGELLDFEPVLRQAAIELGDLLKE